MNESRPTVDPLGVYTVKRTCAELGICYKTLRKYRMNGYIQPRIILMRVSQNRQKNRSKKINDKHIMANILILINFICLV